MMDRRTLVKDLIALTGRSASSLATEIGIHRSNLYTWLKKGGRDVGLDAQGTLLDNLGVSVGTLSPHMVHRWTINQNLDPFREILDWVGEEFEEVVLIPKDIQVKDWFPTSNLFLLYSSSKSIRILLRQKISPLIPAGESSLVNPTNLPLLKWFDIPKGTGIVDKLTSNPLLRIPRNLFDKFMSDSPVSLEEFDQILGSMDKSPPKGESRQEDDMTWESFGREMERRGLRPENVLDMIDREKGENFRIKGGRS